MEDKPKASELLAIGRRHYIVRDYVQSTDVLAKACEALAAEFGDNSDECGEAFLWYGKSLLGLSRGESDVIGDAVLPSGGDNEEEEDEEQNGDGDNEEENGKTGEENDKTDEDAEDIKSKSDKAETPGGSKPASDGTTDKVLNGDAATDKAGTSEDNGEADESVMEDNEDEVDNLQLAWEMLDLSRSILERRGAAGRPLLAEVHLALGEVALESETYDKAIVDMQSCLEIQKEIYASDNRRIAETHYQIGLANSLASNFDDAVTHFKNAANIIETRIKNLEDPSYTPKQDNEKDNLRTVEDEIKELKELLPEIKEKIQDMMDYKAETIKSMREALCPSNGDGASSSSASGSNGAGAGFSSSSATKSTASDITHLIKRKRKSSENEQEGSAAKRANT